MSSARNIAKKLAKLKLMERMDTLGWLRSQNQMLTKLAHKTIDGTLATPTHETDPAADDEMMIVADNITMSQTPRVTSGWLVAIVAVAIVGPWIAAGAYWLMKPAPPLAPPPAGRVLFDGWVGEDPPDD